MKQHRFPLIQGTDCCGRVVEVYPGEEEAIIGERVIVRPRIRKTDFNSMENIWMASDFDGAFAQFVTVPRSEVFTVNCVIRVMRNWQRFPVLMAHLKICFIVRGLEISSSFSQ